MSAPFFIVGASRSGTTMMRLLLNAHSQIGVPKELAYFEQCAIAGGLENWHDPQFKTGTFEDFVRGFVKKKHVALQQVDTEKLVNEILQTGKTSLDVPIRKTLAAWGEEEGKTIWGEKTPKNLFYVDYIHQMLPDAHFIHIIRDPRAVVNSMNRFARFVDDSVLNAFNWLQAADYGFRLLQSSVPAEKRLEIKYEDLVSDVASTARHICAFLGAPFEEDMLDFYTKSSGKLHPNAGQLGGVNTLTRPISTVSVEKWRDQLKARDITLVETVCAEAMKMHGYELVGGKASLSEQLEVKAKLRYCYWQQQKNKHLRSYQLAFKPFERTLRRIGIKSRAQAT